MPPNSCRAAATLPCAACGHQTSVEAWVFIDTVQRPDLLEDVQADRLNIVHCAYCGVMLVADLPVLLFFPNTPDPFLFSPAHSTSDEQNQRHAAMAEGLARRHLAGNGRRRGCAVACTPSDART